MRYATINEAVHAWVQEFNAIPQGMIAKLMQTEPDEWNEVTMPAVGDRVYVYDESASGEIVGLAGDKYIVELDPNGKEVPYSTDDFEIEYDDGLPMWGVMWSFGDSCDDYWLREMNGIKLMSERGFRIYESDKFGYFFGIDGGGYDFYETHWIPLYKAIGLQWHDTKTEEVAV